MPLILISAEFGYSYRETLHSNSVINIAQLSTVASNVVHHVPSLRAWHEPAEFDRVSRSRIARQHIHALRRILHLPDPPDAINHAVMEMENRVAWRRIEVLLQRARS